MVLFSIPEDEFVEELQLGDEKKSSSKMLIIILLVNTTLISVVIGYFIFFYDKKGDEKVDENAMVIEEDSSGEKKSKKGMDLGTGPMIELEPFIVNLDDVTTSKYLKMTINVEVDGPKAEEELLVKKLVARDQILVFLSSLKVNDTFGMEGKASIKEGIINRINNILVNGNVKNVYFKDFVVQ